MEGQEFDIIKSNQLPSASDSEIKKGKVLIITEDRVKQAPSESMKMKFSDLNASEVTALQKPALDAAKKAEVAADEAIQAAQEASKETGKTIQAAAEAEKQANYAKEEGDKASILNKDVEYLKLYKADGMEVENNLLYLTSQGEPITEGIEMPSGGGGGGGGGGSVLRLRNLTGSSLVCIEGQELEIKYSFSSVDSEDGSETGDGNAAYYVNSVLVTAENIRQGDVTKEISRYLKKGSNAVRVTVTDSYGAARSLNWQVEVASVSLSSTFNSDIAYSSDIDFRYTPVGAQEKIIHFILDGEEIHTEITRVTNRELSYLIPAQRHGAHLLEVYATVEVLGTEVRSNSLVYDIICIEPVNQGLIIASDFNATEAKQYTNLIIPFIVYDPASLQSEVTLSVNGNVIAEQTVDRSRQYWNYRLNFSGDHLFEIMSKGVKKTFLVNVVEAEINIEAETRGLQLYLTSANRSNSDNNREEWNYEGVQSSLTGFNWKTNGWIADSSSVALRVSGDARVHIPFKIFESDFRNFGKTIEFEFSTTDVSDYEAVIIDCLSNNIGLRVTAQQAIFRSEQTSVNTRFKEDERVRVSFVVEKRSEYRLIYIYVNGIFSGVAQYPAEDNFQQRDPVGITIGNNNCTVDVFNIRVYDSNLSGQQLLDNFIADIDDLEKKLEIYQKNQVHNEFGEISYNAILQQLPCLIIKGELPEFKGDKKTVSITYTNQQQPAKSFTSENVQIDVQGTSSQYYPRKNFKTKHNGGFVMGGETKDKYQLREESIPVSTFCFKADFAESSGTHNTGMARIIDRLLKQLGLLTPPQVDDERVRTTVDGFPIAIFHQAEGSNDIQFVGKYNFNNDKSTNETFGFSAGDECWEFLNNTSDRNLFLESEYERLDEKGKPEWLNDFEGRYPDGSTDYTRLKIVTDWLVSTNGNPAKFKNEVRDYFDLDNLLSYYVITELFGMVDQRAKNMFLTTWGPENGSRNDIWRFIFYDNDTILGINNEGLIAFNFNIEYHDKQGTQDVWNGERSVLWNNLEATFPVEIEELYQSIRTRGLLSYPLVMNELNKEHSDKWCEAIYNADGKFKYVDPLLDEDNASYLYAAQGSRVEHRKWWTYNRFRYMDSKYATGDFLQDFATLRLYTPDDWLGVEPNCDFTIVPFADQYVRVQYGSYILGGRGTKDIPTFIQAPDIRFNDTETIIYGASRLKSLGDLSGMYAGSIDMSKAVRTTELIIGSGAAGYVNTNLTHLSVGSNKMLRTLDIRNCPNLSQAVGLGGCESIERVYAQGTAITSVILPPAGILSEMHLPGTIANLTIKNQPNLTDADFSIAGIGKLTTLVYENSGGVDVFSIIDRCLSLDNPVLSRARLLGISGEGENLTNLYKLTKIGGLDENGNNTPVAVVTGRYHAKVASQMKLDEMAELWPELIITYDELDPPTVLTFISSASKAITSPVFDCNYPFRSISNDVYQITAEDGDIVEYTFTSENHEPASGSFAITAERKEDIPVTYIPLRTIKVVEDGTNAAVASATVVIVDKGTYTTDSNGVVLLRSRDAISGQVTKANYTGGEFTFGAVSNDVTNTIYMYPKVDVEFTVLDQESLPVSGAVVTCGGSTGTTNANGKCTLRLHQVELSFTVKSPGAIPYTGQVNPRISKTVLVSLVTDPYIYMPEKNGNIQMMMTGTEGYLRITSTTTDYVIHWGDGSTTGAEGTGQKTYTHIYESEEYHQVEVANCREITLCDGGRDGNNSLAAYWSIGDSKVGGVQFDTYRQLLCVGEDILKNFTGTRFSNGMHTGCFYNCSSLLVVPEKLFSPCINLSDFSNTFYGCSSLLEIPALLFKYSSKATTFGNAFSGCSSLQSIPSGLFDNCTDVTTFDSAFKDCSSLQSIPSGLFDSCQNVTSFYFAFYRCSSLQSIPSGLFDSCTDVYSFGYVFYECSSLREIPALLFKESSKAISFDSAFKGCSSLQSIPSGLFDNCTDATTFESAFYGCRSVTTSLPPLWVQYYGTSVKKANCYRYCTLASNWMEVPQSWGGPADEYSPQGISGAVIADYMALEKRISNLEAVMYYNSVEHLKNKLNDENIS